MVVIHYVTIDVLGGGQMGTIVSNSINCLLLLKTKKISSLKQKKGGIQYSPGQNAGIVPNIIL